MISYDPATRIFALQAATSTYAMAVHPAGYLCHLHWGARLVPDATLLDVLDRRCMGFGADHVQAMAPAFLPDCSRWNTPPPIPATSANRRSR